MCAEMCALRFRKGFVERVRACAFSIRNVFREACSAEVKCTLQQKQTVVAVLTWRSQEESQGLATSYLKFR